ncbi:MAG: DNA polymerase III subunit epsilon [Gammaproteobacteria bacterium]|nr:DNA polymerase III subunit epsilon [Gammaproteobacteria bacterium]
MRQVVLDTETTGLDPAQGHRIIEVGCVEIVNRRVTDRTFHQYLNPEREVEAGALQVHGISNEFLADKPRFADVAHDLLEFLAGAELLIHNAAFDVAFLNQELAQLSVGLEPLERHCTVTDTLALARERHPGKKNSLDALCRNYGVDNSRRDLHGALLDAQLLAEVYLAMTGGQVTLSLVPRAAAGMGKRAGEGGAWSGNRARLPVHHADGQEAAAHEARLAALDRASGGRCLWRELGW